MYTWSRRKFVNPLRANYIPHKYQEPQGGGAVSSGHICRKSETLQPRTFLQSNSLKALKTANPERENATFVLLWCAALTPYWNAQAEDGEEHVDAYSEMCTLYTATRCVKAYRLHVRLPASIDTCNLDVTALLKNPRPKTPKGCGRRLAARFACQAISGDLGSARHLAGLAWSLGPGGLWGLVASG